MSQEARKAYNPLSGSHRRYGMLYTITPEEIEQYNDKGYLILNDVLTDEEVS
jgi:hypothetical protein